MSHLRVHRWSYGLAVVAVPAILTMGVLAAPAAAHDTIRSGANHGSANLLANGGFERPGADRSGPAAWTANTEVPSATLKWDHTVSHSGRHSVRIEAPEPADVWWIQSVPVEPNTAYRLTGWVKTENVSHDPNNLNGGAFASYLGMWDRAVPLHGTRDWTQVSATVVTAFDQTELTAAARLGFWSGLATGTAWFDDFELTRVTTAEQVANGGFERGARLAGALPCAWGPFTWGPFTHPTSSAFAWDATVSRSGRHSIRIQLTEPTDALWMQTVEVQPHSYYQLSGWIRTVGVGHTPESVDAGANLSFYWTSDRSQPVFGTQDWTYVSATTYSGDGHYLNLAARLGFFSGQTTGTAWFDDLTLTRLS